MSKVLSTREPKQQRSRETLERLLRATIKVLDEEGLDGAVVPKIAAMAEVAPASIYRRFVDKDALLKAAFMHMLRISNKANRSRLKKALLRDTLEATAERLMALLHDQYRRFPTLFRALSRFMDGEADSEFGREARSHVAENVNLVVDVLMAFSSEIKHGSPRRSLQFAVLSAVSSMEVHTLEPASLWHAVLPLSHKELKAELARGFVAYLRSP
ncbi:TetR family transcriptional regulator [Dyella halodurans]|uniref:TetR/AcrR family transcriptional regulator n=1 Tax=Dyella halodurans TaxID=1920171 RepID=A0ABV9C276_9GAMM|nr:TetR/AcrR family transcriptional regulator [Dyella halodurans]